MFIPVWVLCLIGGWVGGIATAVLFGCYLIERE